MTYQQFQTDFPGYLRTSDGAALFARDWGEGRPLLFLSGWALSSDMWSYQMEPLVRLGYRCIAYDRRGHGRSTDPGRGYDFDTLADDLARIIETFDLDPVVIVGHSFSSGEMVRYVTRHGTKRIAGLIFVAPAAIPFLRRTEDNPLGIPAEILDQGWEQIRQDYPGWLRANAAPYFGPEMSQGLTDWTIGDMHRTSFLAATELSRIQTCTDFRPELLRIDVPVLVIHGDKDASAPIEVTGLQPPRSCLRPGSRCMRVGRMGSTLPTASG